MRRVATLISVITALALALTSCGMVGFVDAECAEIKEQSELKREIGTTFLEMAGSGGIGEGLTPESVEADGIGYIIEGNLLVIDNPQCFTDQEVETAKNLLGR